MRTISEWKDYAGGQDLQRLFFLLRKNPVKMLTPHKEIKNEPEVIRQREKLPETCSYGRFPKSDNR